MPCTQEAVDVLSIQGFVEEMNNRQSQKDRWQVLMPAEFLG
jgi:hypothetical protein